MKRLFFTLMVLFTALGVASVTFAQSTPAEDPKDNACYAGGAWEGKCDWPTDAEDEWAWTCGWYYARAIDGRISADQYPADCGQQVSLLDCIVNDFLVCFYSDGSFSITELFTDEDVDPATWLSVGKVGQYDGENPEDVEACFEAAQALFEATYGNSDDYITDGGPVPVNFFSDGTDGYEDDERWLCIIIVLPSCPFGSNTSTDPVNSRC